MKLLDLVADERDRRLAGEGRGDAQLRLVARRVGGLVEGDDHIVGRVGARRARPADVERDAGLLAVERLDVEAVRPQPTARGNFAGASAPMSTTPLGEPLRRLDRLVAPASVAVEPLVVVGDLIERPGRALARDPRPVGSDGDRLERRADRRREIEESKSCLTPITTPFARTGSVRVRSTVRPPDSATSTMSFASSGRVGSPSGRSTESRRGPWRRSAPCRGTGPRPW